MFTPVPTTVVLTHPVASRAELDAFLASGDYAIATNSQIPSERFHELTTPNWVSEALGLIVMMVRTTDTQEPDPDSPLGRKIVPIPSTPERENPVLSRFLAGACAPWSFETYGAIPKDQVILVIEDDHC